MEIKTVERKKDGKYITQKSLKMIKAEIKKLEKNCQESRGYADAMAALSR